MGGTCSMPDGSELKAPEERVPHEVMVRANVALVFIKPHAHTPECIELVRTELSRRVTILGESDMGGQKIAQAGLVDQHYAEIAKNAMTVKPADLPVGDETKEKFKQVFSSEWDAAIAAGAVLNAADCAQHLDVTPRDLFNMWQPATKLKIAPGAYVARLKGGGEDFDDEPEPDLFVVDGFYPALRDKFTRDDATVRLFVVAFDPKRLSWAQFRRTVVGTTNPTEADDQSLRAKILANYESLGLKEPPDNTDNGVHGSAGPLEALKERLLWLNFALDKDPTGSRLAELAVWDESKHHVITDLLQNPSATTHSGQTGSAFDLTEDKDTPDLYILANNIAFADTLPLIPVDDH